MVGRWQIVFLFVLFLLLGCSSPPALTPDANSQGIAIEQVTAISVPPTFTPLSVEERQMTAVPQVTVTQNPLPTVATDTPVPFGETAVELRYTIPSIGLDRRLQGNVSSQIIIANEATGDIVKRENQASVLIELQQLLPTLELEPFPEGCSNCVYVSYHLPFDGIAADGWLTDRTILASIENYLAISLGPHFPANTQIGLRRSATPFAPAHTIALTEDGLLYFWFATDSELPEPVVANPALFEALTQLDIDSLAQQYQAPCAGTPVETLFLNNGEVNQWINIVCPEYTLPTTLLPVYSILDAEAAARIAVSDNTTERPPTSFPLNGILDYQRIDGAQLTILNDGTAVAVSPSNQTLTTTLSSSEVLSLTTTLLESNQLKLGLTSFLGDSSVPTDDGTPTPLAPRSVLLVRGSGGVYDGFWEDTTDIALLDPLNELLTQIIGDVSQDQIDDATDDELTTGGTPSSEATVTVEPTSTATPEP